MDLVLDEIRTKMSDIMFIFGEIGYMGHDLNMKKIMKVLILRP